MGAEGSWKSGRDVDPDLCRQNLSRRLATSPYREGERVVPECERDKRPADQLEALLRKDLVLGDGVTTLALEPRVDLVESVDKERSDEQTSGKCQRGTGPGARRSGDAREQQSRGHDQRDYEPTRPDVG